VVEQAGVEDDPAEQQQPEGQRVEPRKGHVPGADHQRDEVVAEPGHHRHDEQEDHRRPVNREQLVVVLRGDQRVVRNAELEPHQQCLDAPQDEEHERRDHVHDPDLLVIGRRHPVQPALGLARRRHLVGDHLGNWSECVFGR
jgi:hypothetical protein